MFFFFQLILPECMKLLPVYLNCVLKSDVLLPGADVSLDDRAYLRQLISCMDVAETHVFFYPRLLPLVQKLHFALMLIIKCKDLDPKVTSIFYTTPEVLLPIVILF